MKKERQDETQFTTKIGGKTNWVPVISLCKIFIPNYMFGCVFVMQQKCGPQLQWNSNVFPIVFAKLSWTSKDLLHWIIISPYEDVKPLLFMHVFFFGATM